MFIFRHFNIPSILALHPWMPRLVHGYQHYLKPTHLKIKNANLRHGCRNLLIIASLGLIWHGMDDVKAPKATVTRQTDLKNKSLSQPSSYVFHPHSYLEHARIPAWLKPIEKKYHIFYIRSVGWVFEKKYQHWAHDIQSIKKTAEPSPIKSIQSSSTRAQKKIKTTQPKQDHHAILNHKQRSYAHLSLKPKESLAHALRRTGHPTALAPHIQSAVADVGRLRPKTTLDVVFSKNKGAYTVWAVRIHADKKVTELVAFQGGKNSKNRLCYYTPEGKSLSCAMRRYPVSRVSISSGYTNRRLHPILGVYRPHQAIDFSAPYGTPVYATGNGRIVAAHEQSGYGKIVQIKHPGSYETRYAHLSRFGKRIKNGQPVKVGDIIGYVGQSGHATSSHLHYELHHKGKHINPLTAPLPKQSNLSGKQRRVFLASARTHLNYLHQNRYLAMQSNKHDRHRHA